MQLPALLRSSRLLTSLRGCALGNGGSAPAVAAAALRCTAPAPQSRCFAVPSHIPEADEPWPEGRRAPEGERNQLSYRVALVSMIHPASRIDVRAACVTRGRHHPQSLGGA